LRLRWQLWARLDALLRLVDHYRAVVALAATSEDEEPPAETKDGGRKSALSIPQAAAPLWRRLWHTRRRATISFLVLPDRVLIIRRGWLALDFGVSPATRIEVRELVRRWHEFIARAIQERARGLGAPPAAETQASA